MTGDKMISDCFETIGECGEDRYPFKSQSSIVLSFYFKKQNGSDLTDILAKETEEIYLGNINSETI